MRIPAAGGSAISGDDPNTGKGRAPFSAPWHCPAHLSPQMYLPCPQSVSRRLWGEMPSQRRLRAGTAVLEGKGSEERHSHLIHLRTTAPSLRRRVDLAQNNVARAEHTPSTGVREAGEGKEALISKAKDSPLKWVSAC